MDLVGDLLLSLKGAPQTIHEISRNSRIRWVAESPMTSSEPPTEENNRLSLYSFANVFLGSVAT